MAENETAAEGAAAPEATADQDEHPRAIHSRHVI